MSATSRASEWIGYVDRSVHHRLNRRLFAWFLLLSLVPLFLTNAVGYQRSERILRRTVTTSLTNLLDAEGREVRDRIDSQLRLLQAIAGANTAMADGVARAGARADRATNTGDDDGTLHDVLDARLRDPPAFEAMFLVLPDGRIIASAGPSMPTRITPPRAYRPVALDPPFKTASGQPQLRFAVPLLDHSGGVVGYLGATAAMDRSRALLPSLGTNGTDTYVVDQSGRPLLVSNPRVGIDYSVPVTSPLAREPAGSMTQYRRSDGEEVIAIADSIPGYPWRLIAESPTDSALGELRRLRWLSIILEIAFVALLIVAARRVSNDIVMPLQRLVEATHRVEHGDLAVRVKVREPDEMGELQRAFNEMTNALETTTARVRELHQHEIERAAQLATVGELASGVAHEIKNPVVGIISGLDLVQRRVGADATLTPILDEMARQLTRIRQTVQGLLTFARPAAPSLAVVSGNHVLERSCRLVTPSALKLGVRIELALDPRMPRIVADEDQLHQALVNLLMNAIEASSEGSAIDVSSETNESEFMIAIADHGHGIPTNDLEQVFKPFFTTRHTGSGLGLPISHEIIRRHGGRLTLDHTDGGGTTARIFVPVEPPSGSGVAALREDESR